MRIKAVKDFRKIITDKKETKKESDSSFCFFIWADCMSGACGTDCRCKFLQRLSKDRNIRKRGCNSFFGNS